MRYIVDELALTTLSNAGSVRESLEGLTDLLLDLRRQREPVAVLSSWASGAVAESDVGTYLSTTSADERDLARLAMSLLDKCDKWDDDEDIYVEPAAHVDNRPWESFGVALAARRVMEGHATGCVTVISSHQGGTHEVFYEVVANVIFVVSPADCRILHRQRLELECGSETEYLDIARSAFPSLILAPSLTFRRFEGTFEALRPHVTTHLSALDDKFVRVHREEAGHLDRVSVRLGIDISNEGGTRASERLMRLRDVEVGGVTYRCEMHSKLERHRNRIHFALTGAVEVNSVRVVVGIFVSHLQT